MDRSEQRRIVEALVLASPEPVSAARLAEIVPACTPGDTKDLVNELNTEYQEHDRSFEIWEVAGGYQVRTRAEFSGYLQQLQKQRPLRLSRAALDSLSIIAYKQPVTRLEIEDIRGVDAGAVLKGLLDRRLIRIAGHREVPGRPMLYATTRRFLEVFGLDTLKSLPSLRELKELADEKGVVLPGGEDADAIADAEAVPGDEQAADSDSGGTGAAEGMDEAEAGDESEAEAGDGSEAEAGDESEGRAEPVIGASEQEDAAAGQGVSSEPGPEADEGWDPPEIVEPGSER